MALLRNASLSSDELRVYRFCRIVADVNNETSWRPPILILFLFLSLHSFSCIEERGNRSAHLPVHKTVNYATLLIPFVGPQRLFGASLTLHLTLF